MSTEITRIVLRRGTAAAWTAANPVLLSGESGLETDTKRTKMGDGATLWAALPYDLDVASANSTYARITGRDVSVWDYAAIGDGVADDSAAITAAITAAGIGGRVSLSKSTRALARFKCLTTLTMLAEQTLDGGSFRLGKTVGTTAEIVFPTHAGTTVGLQLGPDCSVENLLVRGPGNSGGGIGIKNDSTGGSGPSHSARLKNVSVTGWAVGVELAACYYGYLDGCEFAINGTGLRLTNSCNNIALHVPRFLCQSNWDGGTGGTAIEVDTCAGLTITGGSIEEYGAGGAIRYGSNLNMTILGTYFESVFAGAFGLKPIAGTVTKTTINLRDAYILLNNHTQWCNFDAVNSVLNSSGHRFTGTLGAPFAYSVNPTNSAATNNTVDLRGDSWEDAPAGGYYCDTYALTARGYTIAPPRAYTVGGFGGNDFRGRKTVHPASTAAAGASLNVPHGILPTTPADGDMWTTTAGLFVRVNGVTKTVTLT